MLRECVMIWLRNPSLSVPFIIHQFLRYGILTVLVLYTMIELGTTSTSELIKRFKDFMDVIAVAAIADLTIEGYFISAEIKACYDAINGQMDLDQAIKFAFRTIPSMFVILLTVALSTIPTVIGLLNRDIAILAISSIYLTVLVISLTFVPLAIVIDGLNPAKSIIRSIEVVKSRIGKVLTFWAFVGLILISYALILRMSMNSIILLFILNLLILPAVIMPIIFIWWILLYIR